MVQIYEKIKDCPGRFHSYFQSSVGTIRKPNSAIDISASQDKGDLGGHIIEPKVVNAQNQINKTMTEKTKKLLFFLPADSKWSRIIRRGVIIGILTFAAIVIKEFIPSAPDTWVAILTGVLALLDKGIREFSGK